MLDIAIIGAGPGGLITALRLHQQGFRPRIYESVQELKPLGVGVDIKVYGTKELEDLGLLEDFRAMSVDADDSIFYNHHGQEIYAEKCGVHMGYLHEQRFVHRGYLQMMFYDKVLERLGPDSVQLGVRVTGYSQDVDGVTLDLAHRDGRIEQVRHDAVIAADGIKSAVRKQMHPDLSEPTYSGITMYRGTTLREPYRGGHTILHIGDPRISTMIVYPIAEDFEGTGKDLVNWVVEYERPDTAAIEDWNQVGTVDEIVPLYDTVDLPFLDVQQLMRDAREVYLFPLIRHEPLDTWVDGRVVLLGDAAHAMYPRGGNGVCQAFLDARVVAEKLAETNDPHEAFVAYDDARRVAVNRVMMSMRGEGYEVIRRMVAERTDGQPFSDIEEVLPLAEADEIFSNYHRMVGQPLRAGHDEYSSGFRTVAGRRRVMSVVRDATAEEAEELLAVEDRRRSALIAVDLDALDDLFDDSLVHIHAPGVTMDKAQLREHTETRRAYLEIARGDLRARMVGDDVAVLTGAITNRLRTAEGGERTLAGVATQVLHRDDDGAWRFVTFQMTPLGEQAWGALPSQQAAAEGGAR